MSEAPSERLRDRRRCHARGPRPKVRRRWAPRRVHPLQNLPGIEAGLLLQAGREGPGVLPGQAREEWEDLTRGRHRRRRRGRRRGVRRRADAPAQTQGPGPRGSTGSRRAPREGRARGFRRGRAPRRAERDARREGPEAHGPGVREAVRREPDGAFKARGRARRSLSISRLTSTRRSSGWAPGGLPGAVPGVLPTQRGALHPGAPLAR